MKGEGERDAMTDHGSYELKASKAASGTVTRGAESWQFFAFVFAATVTLALALVDELPGRLWPWRIVAKAAVFVGLAYVTLVNVRVRNWLVRMLGAFQEERR